MGAVAVGALLFALLLVVLAAMLWQEARSARSAAAVYFIDDAARFVTERLSPSAAARLQRDDVARILEWGIEEHVARVGAPGSATAVVLGSGETIEGIMERSERELGAAYDPVDIAEVIAAESDYLEAIGAVGRAVEEVEQ
jgi:hypothetical protein